MRLVDADALIEKLKSNFDNGDVYTDKDQFIIDCIHLLDNAPTVEIDLVKVAEEHEKIGFKKGFNEGYAQAQVDLEDAGLI